MTKEKDFRKPMMRIFVSYFGTHKKLFILDMSCAFLVAAIDVAFPLVSRFAMYELLPGKLYQTFFYRYDYHFDRLSAAVDILLCDNLSRTQIRHTGGG